MNQFNKNNHINNILIVLIFWGIIIGSIIVGKFVQQNYYTMIFDRYLYEKIHFNNHYAIIDLLIFPFNYNFLPNWLSPLRMPSYYYFMGIFTMIYLYFFKRQLVLYALGCFVLATALSMVISSIDWHFVFRERPFITLPNTVDQTGQNAWKLLSSYPSGHARETTLYATIITHFIPKITWLMIVFVLFIAYSRIYIGAHFPTDVLAGVIIGYTSAKITIMIIKKIESNILIERRSNE